MTSPASAGPRPGGECGRLRRRLLLLAWIVLGGIGVELASTRHWETSGQLMAWLAVGLAAAGLVMVAHPSGRRIALAGRVLLVVVGVVALVGVWLHVYGNYEAGALDHRYALTWEAMPAMRQWWLAVSGGVGPSPPLVPLMLGLVVVLSYLACPRDQRTADDPPR